MPAVPAWASREGSNALAEKAELVDNLGLIDRGLEDVKAGRLRDARAGIHELARKHGIAIAG